MRMKFGKLLENEVSINKFQLFINKNTIFKLFLDTLRTKCFFIVKISKSTFLCYFIIFKVAKLKKKLKTNVFSIFLIHSLTINNYSLITAV